MSLTQKINNKIKELGIETWDIAEVINMTGYFPAEISEKNIVNAIENPYNKKGKLKNIVYNILDILEIEDEL